LTPEIIESFRQEKTPATDGPLEAATTVMDEDPKIAELAASVAVTVTLGGFGGVAGAPYRPTEFMVPRLEFPPGIEFTCQLTVESVAF
jgi:hypothetical protein